MSACEEEDGRPSHQVARFHEIAPSTPAITITSAPTVAAVVASGASTAGSNSITSETVWATFCPRNAPMKFITAASARATRGVSARVETEVAIAFAASWKPLV